MKYVATINVPGYLPTDDDPPVFDTPGEAWQYLADERREGETECDGEEWSETVHELDARASAALSGEPFDIGTVYGDTPGYEGDHDLGLAYSVNEWHGTPDDTDDNSDSTQCDKSHCQPRFGDHSHCR